MLTAVELVFAGAMRGCNVPRRGMSAAGLSYIFLWTQASRQWSSSLDLPRHPRGTSRSLWAPWRRSTGYALQMMASSSEKNSMWAGAAARRHLSGDRRTHTHTHTEGGNKMLCLQSRRCGFILISRGLSSFFTVTAVLLPPRVLWGGEQRAQQREKQIPQHFTMWVRLRCLWPSVPAQIWHPTLCFTAETEGKPTLPLPSPTDDHSRVVLSHDGHPCSDYINASYINVNVRSTSSFSGNLASYW